MMSRSPISWVGGKYYLAKKLMPLFPEHRRYVEPMGGAAHVLFRKEPSEMEVYNDIDGSLVNFFNVVKKHPEKLIEKLDFSLYSREVFLNALKTLDEGTDVERAAKFYLVNRQCFGGKMETWGITMTGCKCLSAYGTRIRGAHERLKRVYIEHLDFRDLIKRYDSPDAFFLCDPPYIFNESRSKRVAYRNEMSQKDHEDLVEILKNIKGKFILCGYENPLYSAFERVSVGESNMCVNKCTGGKRIKKREYIWKNYQQ